VDFSVFDFLSQENKVGIKDFFVDEKNWQEDGGKKILQLFLEFVVNKILPKDRSDLEIEYPSAIVHGGKLFEDFEINVKMQESFLYRVIGGNLGDTETFVHNMCGVENPTFENCKHVFWDVDKF